MEPARIGELAWRMLVVRRLVDWFDVRRRVVAVAMVGWVALTVIGDGASPSDDSWVGLSALRYLGWALAVVAGVGGALVLIAAVLSRGQNMPRQDTKRSRWWWVPFVVAGLLFLLLDPELPSGDGTDDASPAEPVEEVSDSGERVDSFDVLALVIGIALTTGAILWTRGRLSIEVATEDDDHHAASAVADAIELAAHELLRASDPRSAVLNAYAVLEQHLAHRGKIRRSPETPSEHIARVLDDLDLDPRPIVELGALYERARFSTEPITVEDQHRAAAALHQAQDDLLTGPVVS